MNAPYFTDENTEGYTRAQLALANRLFESRTKGLDEDEDADDIQHIGERVLREVEGWLP